ncbi:hypothetical protein JXO59_01760 [candidate division KSB1 bacterium]|nr:hypothetical protein [candidate division KSB1 bacterium]
MTKNASVRLSEIVDAMEMQAEGSHQFLHLATGEIYYISDEEFDYAKQEEPLDHIPDWQIESVERAKTILSTEEYLALPSTFDIHEYAIMERFCLSITDDALRDKMYNAIKGSGAFRRFKENIFYHNIEQDWYQFREEAFYKIAVDWCNDNKIPFIDDRNKEKSFKNSSQ